MGRQHRFDPPGGFHHVMHRGSRRQRIFESEADHREFLRRLEAVQARSGIQLHAFALMTNHYHLLVECPAGGISEAMKRLNAGYAQWFNWRHGYDGHLFRGRFRSILVGDDRYFVELARYIHRNSLQAGLVAAPVDDPWSSHRFYVNGRPPCWLSTDRVLSYFAGDQDRFAAFVEAPDSPAALEVLEAVDEQRPAIGSQSFLARLARDTDAGPAAECSARRVVPTHVEQLARQARADTTMRPIFIAAARRNGAPYRLIAEHFELNATSTARSTVRRIERRALNEPAVEQRIAEALAPFVR